METLFVDSSSAAQVTWTSWLTAGGSAAPNTAVASAAAVQKRTTRYHKNHLENQRSQGAAGSGSIGQSERKQIHGY
jgi:hypothetical protein